MKTLVAIFLLTGLAVCQAVAQVQETDLSQEKQAKSQVQTTADSVLFQAKMVQRIFGVELTVDGVLPKAIAADNPLQLINPLAPAEYGDGYDNVSVEPDTGRASGIRFLMIRF